MDTPRPVHTFLRAFLAALVCCLAFSAAASAYIGGSVDDGYAGTTAGGDTSTSGAQGTSVRLTAIQERRAVANRKARLARKAALERRRQRLRHHRKTTPVVTETSSGSGSTGSTSGSTGTGEATPPTESTGSTPPAETTPPTESTPPAETTPPSESPGTGGPGGGHHGHRGGSSGGGKTPPAEETPTGEPPTVEEEEPPAETPPVEEEAPPAETPPVETPPKETPPVETPPVETPPTGTQTSHCFAAPHLCGYPDPTNTGVPAGVTLTPSGSITVTQAGTVISGKQVTGTINVVANNVTIENTKVIQNTTCGPKTTCGNFAIRIDEAASNVTIRNVETSSVSGDTCEHDIRNTGGTVTIENAYLHACDSNIYAAGPTTLKNSYGIAKLAMSEDHVENVYFNETTFNAIHDTLLNPIEQTAVIFGNSGGGNDVTNCSNHLTITESLIGGGGYTLYPCAHASKVGSSTFDIERNHFVRCATAESYVASNGTHPCSGGADSSGYFANSGSFGLAANYFTTGGVWRGNVWDNNLGKVCLGGGSSCE